MIKKQKETQILSNLRVAVTSSSFSKSAVLRKKLKESFPDSFFNENCHRFSEAELIEFLKNADAAVVGTEFLTEQVLRNTPQLKIISKYGVGLDNIDLDAMKRRNIALGWTGGINKRSVAELTLCFMLGLCRNIFSAGFKLKLSEWKKDGGRYLTGRTVGIIGCGYTGSELIRLLKPFKCDLLVHDIIDKSKICNKFNATVTSLDDVISRSDIISLHVPLDSSTRGMVDDDFLRKMQPTAFLINTSRGEVVDQQALKESLKNRLIAGAALDVFTEEPPDDQEFLSLPNLMVTPHIAGNALESVEAMGQSAIHHLVEFFKNR